MFSTAQWIAWIGATLTGTFGIIGFAYTNFETRDHAREQSQVLSQRIENESLSLEKRLDRIESKVDLLLQESRKR